MYSNTESASVAHGTEIDLIANRMVEERAIKPARAEALLEEMRLIELQVNN